MASPPKPWERGASATGPATTATAAPPPVPSASTSTAPAPATDVPSIPDRPAALSPTSALSQPYNSLSSPYSSYSSPYNRFGSTYSPYGGYGGAYGSTYGGFGSYGGMGMYPGFGNGFMPGAPYPGFDPSQATLAQSFEAGTQQTFALLGSVVQTFSGVAQMLESTFMATHSSFTALVAVADQFARLRAALGGIIGLFGLVSWLRESITGRRADPLRGEFRAFIDGRPVQGPAPRPKARRGPLIVFLLAIIGVPWAMHRLIRALAARQAALPGALPPLDASQLTFARATHPFNAQSPSELALKPDEIVAVIAKLDPRSGAEVDPRVLGEEAGIEADWWKGRTRDGREGWFPRAFVQIIERKKQPEKSEPKNVE